MRILVLGYIVRGPLGGMSWHHLQYILGLKELGHEVLFAEDSDDYPGCYNPETNEVNKDSNYGLNYIDNLFKKFDLGSQWSYFDAHTNKWFGQNEGSVRKFCDGADMVLNISGINPERDWWSKIPLRVLIDTDPAFTQIRHLTEEGSNQFAAIHNCFFSFGENFGKDFCTIPRDAYNWLPTRQPVYLKAWKSSIPNPDLKWTTVMQWDSYKSKEFNDKMYGMKSISFQDYVNFPEVMPDEKFELALGAEASIVENLKRVNLA